LLESKKKSGRQSTAEITKDKPSQLGIKRTNRVSFDASKAYISQNKTKIGWTIILIIIAVLIMIIFLGDE
jgi:hypothetical protein